MIRNISATSRCEPAVAKRIRQEAAVAIGNPSRGIPKEHISNVYTIAAQLFMTADGHQHEQR
eukprot:820239-Pyramimonas_sp.AAC.1